MEGEQLVLYFAARLRFARDSAGLTALDLARAVGATERAVRYWESGERSPRISQLAAIGRAVDRHPAWFLAGFGGVDEEAVE